jgi:hypothetical protein
LFRAILCLFLPGCIIGAGGFPHQLSESKKSYAKLPLRVVLLTPEIPTDASIRFSQELRSVLQSSSYFQVVERESPLQNLLAMTENQEITIKSTPERADLILFPEAKLSKSYDGNQTTSTLTISLSQGTLSLSSHCWEDCGYGWKNNLLTLSATTTEQDEKIAIENLWMRIRQELPKRLQKIFEVEAIVTEGNILQLPKAGPPKQAFEVQRKDKIVALATSQQNKDGTITAQSLYGASLQNGDVLHSTKPTRCCIELTPTLSSGLVVLNQIPKATVGGGFRFEFAPIGKPWLLKTSWDAAVIPDVVSLNFLELGVGYHKWIIPSKLSLSIGPQLQAGQATQVEAEQKIKNVGAVWGGFFTAKIFVGGKLWIMPELTGGTSVGFQEWKNEQNEAIIPEEFSAIKLSDLRARLSFGFAL